MTRQYPFLKRAFPKAKPGVFLPASILIFAIVSMAAFFPEATARNVGRVQSFIVSDLSWFTILTVAVILLSTVYVAASRFGSIRLGPDDSAPAHALHTWFAMLFSCGMGIGIMFFGVAEPVMHFLEPPVGEGGSVEAAREALELTFFHWGLHAWAIYAAVGLVLAYFSYRQRLPLTMRSALYPLIGDRIDGPIGNAVDVFAVLGTVFGVATSMGFGVLQISGGLNHLFGIEPSVVMQSVLILFVTGLAAVSAASGLGKGIKWLSEANLFLALALLLMVIVVGPTTSLLKHFVENTGLYISGLISKTFNLYAYEPKSLDWLGGWTLLYWGWWLSWSPFVGLFIARISRGRTIREFITGVLLVPAGFTLLWMTAFGNSAIDLIMNRGAATLAATVKSDVSVALFEFFNFFPMSQVLTGVALLMILIFFVTSADSGALVADTLSSGGASKTPARQKVYWCAVSGLSALFLLKADGLTALQTITLVSALPFSVVMLFALAGLFKALRADDLKRQSLLTTKLAPVVSREPGSWRHRIRTILRNPSSGKVEEYTSAVIRPALLQVAAVFRTEGLDAQLKHEKNRLTLVIHFDGVDDFVYQIRLKNYAHTEIEVEDAEEAEDDWSTEHMRAEVFLREGGQDYDVMGWSGEQIIHDVLDQYEKHLGFLRRVNRLSEV